jgi:hypothetical protein
VGDLSQHLGSTLNAFLIWLCAALALRYAIAREFRAHRRWALRLFLVVSASWFLRIGLFLSFVIFKGPMGFDPTTFRGPFLTFLSFGQYLVPLAVLELYFWTQARPGQTRRIAMAAGLGVLTLAMAAGIVAAGTATWLPQARAAYDSRKSITETLSATIASGGIEQAIKRYHDLKDMAPDTYNFDERQLNDLGYQLLRTKKFQEAIRIFSST